MSVACPDCQARADAQAAVLARFDTLTPRDLELMRLLTLGLPNKKIASHIGLKWPYVNQEIDRLYKILGVHSRLQAVRIAWQAGLG